MVAWSLVTTLLVFGPAVAEAQTGDPCLDSNPGPTVDVPDVTMAATSNLNLRVGPAAPYCEVILTIPSGGHVTKTHEAGEWASVLYGGQRGWAHSDYLRPVGEPSICSNPPTPSNLSEEMILSHPQYETQQWKVWLRTGPSGDCTDPVAIAEDNSTVTRIGTSGSWSRVRYTFSVPEAGTFTRVGWVETEFLTPVDDNGGGGPTICSSPPTPTNLSDQMTLSHPEYESKGWQVWVREGPSSDCDALAIAEDNSTVTRMGTSGSWSRVRYTFSVPEAGTFTRIGWVETDFLTPVSGGICSDPPTPSNLSEQMILSHPEFEAKGWKVWLRKGPSFDCANPLAIAEDNSTVTRIGVSGSWSRIRLTQSVPEAGTFEYTGWVETEFLSPLSGGIGSCADAPTPSNLSEQMILSHPEFEAKGWRVWVREGPSMDCDALVIADDNVTVSRIGVSGSWSRVVYRHSIPEAGTYTFTGWVETEFLTPSDGGICTNPPTPNDLSEQMIISHPEFEAKGWRVWVRSGPSMDCGNPLAIAEDNATVTRIGTSGTWSRVVYTYSVPEAGTFTATGWVESSFLTRSITGGGSCADAPTPSNLSEQMILSHPEYETKQWKVWVREGPSMDCDRLVIADDNVVVSRIGTSGTWSRITYNHSIPEAGTFAYTGWVETEFLTPVDDGGGGPVPGGPHPDVVNAQGAPRVIFDTDMGPDIDDALALAMLHAYANEGKATIEAVTLSRNSNVGAEYIDIVNTFYGRPDIPIGIFRGSTDADNAEWAFTGRIVDKAKSSDVYPYDLSGSSAPEGWQVMRDVLRRSPDNSVVIVQVGFSTNTAKLLREEPELVAQKARLLSVMGGHTEPDDFNTRFAPYDAQTVYARWPTTLLQSPSPTGNNILYPLSSIQNDLNIANHPIKDSYLNADYPTVLGWHPAQGSGYDMRSWDLTSVMGAIEQPSSYFGPLSGPGKVTADPTNSSTSFTTGEGSHYQMAQGFSSSARNRIVQRMTELVTAPPSGGNNNDFACNTFQLNPWTGEYPIMLVVDGAGPLSLQDRPADVCPSVESIGADDALMIIGTAFNSYTNENWLQVQTSTGAQGYVPADALIRSDSVNTGNSVVDAIKQAVEGCWSAFVDRIGALLEAINTLIAIAKDPSGELQAMVDNLVLLYEEATADPEAFAVDLLEQVGNRDLYDREGAAAWAGYMICDIAIDLLSGGSKFAAVMDDINDWSRRKRNDRDGPRVCSLNSFPAGTSVLAADGSPIPIQDVGPGQLLLTFNTSTGAWSPNVVLDQWSALHTDPMVTITLADGSAVSSTDDHRYWVSSDGQWVEADDLEPGDLLLTPDGVSVVHSTEVHDPVPTQVWELDTAVDDTFAVLAGTSAVLVHNADRCDDGTGGQQIADLNPAQFSKGELKIHYEKHGAEFGDITQVEYLRLAREFAAEVSAEFLELKVGNFLLKYDPVSRRILVIHAGDRRFRTFYIADDRTEDPWAAAIAFAEELGGG